MGGSQVEETPDLRSVKDPGTPGEWQRVQFGEQKGAEGIMVEKAVSLAVETEAEGLFQDYRIKHFGLT